MPAIGLGWAHKYEMLFQDFDCERCLIASDTPIEEVLEEIAMLTETTLNSARRQQIGARLEGMLQLNQNMWQRVVDLLTTATGQGVWPDDAEHTTD